MHIHLDMCNFMPKDKFYSCQNDNYCSKNLHKLQAYQIKLTQFQKKMEVILRILVDSAQSQSDQLSFKPIICDTVSILLNSVILVRIKKQVLHQENEIENFIERELRFWFRFSLVSPHVSYMKVTFSSNGMVSFWLETGRIQDFPWGWG